MIRIALVAALVLLALPAPVQALTPWRVAVVVYDAIDAVCQGRQITASLVNGEQDVAEALTDLEAARARIEAAGHGSIAFTVIRAGTLTGDLTPYGSECWPAPDDIAMPAGFDSVYVLYEADADPDPGVNSWGGLSFACGGCPLYATSHIWDGDQDWFGHAGFFLHEFGNNLTAFYQPIFGAEQVPSLYADQSRYRFTSWYDDWYGGRLFDTFTGQYVGLTRKVWAVTPTSSTAPTCRNTASNAKACRP